MAYARREVELTVQGATSRDDPALDRLADDPALDRLADDHGLDRLADDHGLGFAQCPPGRPATLWFDWADESGPHPPDEATALRMAREACEAQGLTVVTARVVEPEAPT